jgi:uncharacterized membrane protein
MFATVLALALTRIWKPALSELTSVALIFLTLTSVLYYAFLTYIEIWVIEAICQWCVMSSLVTAGILVLEVWRFWRADSLDVS